MTEGSIDDKNNDEIILTLDDGSIIHFVADQEFSYFYYLIILGTIILGIILGGLLR